MRAPLRISQAIRRDATTRGAFSDTSRGNGACRRQTCSTAIVNLNSASATDLEALPGIGAKTAARLVEYREKNGPFKKVEELRVVRAFMRSDGSSVLDVRWYPERMTPKFHDVAQDQLYAARRDAVRAFSAVRNGCGTVRLAEQPLLQSVCIGRFRGRSPTASTGFFRGLSTRWDTVSPRIVTGLFSRGSHLESHDFSNTSVFVSTARYSVHVAAGRNSGRSFRRRS